jgi:hypothetical protein
MPPSARAAVSHVRSSVKSTTVVAPSPDDDAVPFLAQEPGDPDAKSMDADRYVGESVAA